MTKINFTHEILECFKEQYREKYDMYTKFVQRGFSFAPFIKSTYGTITFEDLVSYSNILEGFTFLLAVIRELEEDLKNE